MNKRKLDKGRVIMKKYELTNETKVINNGVELHRIKALEDFGNVKKGDLGGWIEKEENLSQIGDAWVSDDAMVYGNAVVTNDAWVYANAVVTDDAVVTDNAWVHGKARLYANAVVTGDTEVSGNAVVYGNIREQLEGV